MTTSSRHAWQDCHNGSTDASLHGIFDWLVGYTEKCVYKANALAIKYTAATAGRFRSAGLAVLQEPGEPGASPTTPSAP